MPGGVLHADRASLRNPEQCKAIQFQIVNDGLEIRDPFLERQIGYVPIGQAVAPLVEPDKQVVARQLAEHVAPDGAVPVVLEMVQPIRSLDERVSGP